MKSSRLVIASPIPFLVALVVVACSDDPPGTTDPCGSHGRTEAGRCACEEGYVERDGACVFETGVDAGSAPVVDDGGACGPNAERRGEGCACEAGYTEDDGVCVPSAPDASDAGGGGDPCAPGGHRHGDHCHCDEGYVEADNACVALDAGGGDGGDDDGGVGDPCGPHGHQHGDHCHCDEGYAEAGGTCISVAVEPCGGGHRHGARCVCYAGHAYDPTADTCKAVEIKVLPPVSFKIVPLGEPDTSSGVNAVNDQLRMVGNKRAPGNAYLSSYVQGITGSAGTFGAGPITDIGVLPTSTNLFSRPWDINWYGAVVGESGNSDPVLPFLYLPGTGLQQLKLPPGSASAVAHGINDAGEMVGIGSSRAIHWASAHAVPTFLPTHPGATVVTSRAWKLNEQGDIVGHARDVLGRQRATLWRHDGTMVDLGSLNPAHASEAVDVNESGQIVGRSFVGVVPGSTTGTLQGQAFLYEEGSMRGLGLLPSLPAAVHSVANAVNDAGWVVGHVEQIAGLASRAVLWRNGQIVDLNDYLPTDSGWTLTSAVDVTTRGDIVGRGTFAGSSRPFMLLRAD